MRTIRLMKKYGALSNIHCETRQEWQLQPAPDWGWTDKNYFNRLLQTNAHNWIQKRELLLIIDLWSSVSICQGVHLTINSKAKLIMRSATWSTPVVCNSTPAYSKLRLQFISCRNSFRTTFEALVFLHEHEDTSALKTALSVAVMISKEVMKAT